MPLRREGNMAGRCGVALLGAVLLLVTGCDTNKAPLGPGFGNAVQHNMFVHIVKPRVPDPAAAPPDLEGPRSLRSIDRYHRGETEEPKPETTTTTPGPGGAK